MLSFRLIRLDHDLCLCVCVCVCVCVHLSVCVCVLSVCVCVCVCACVFVCMFVFMHASVWLHVLVCMCVCMCVCVCLCVFMCIYVCLCLCMSVLCIYVCVFMLCVHVCMCMRVHVQTLRISCHVLQSRKGWISRKELRKILNTFKFRTSNEQFRELMMLLDPLNTNCISYHKFLDLFEEKEDEVCVQTIDLILSTPVLLSTIKTSLHWKNMISAHNQSQEGRNFIDLFQAAPVTLLFIFLFIYLFILGSSQVACFLSQACRQQQTCHIILEISKLVFLT